MTSHMMTFSNLWDFLHSSRVDDYTRDHSLRVMKRDLYRSGDDVVIVAMCHDLIEDDLATADELRTMGVSNRQLDAIFLVTRDKKDQTYAQYIDKIIASKDHVAISVKMLDIYDHLSPQRLVTGSRSRVTRYIKALTKLSMALVKEV